MKANNLKDPCFEHRINLFDLYPAGDPIFNPTYDSSLGVLKSSQLPRKPSVLLALGLRDLRAVAKNRRYVIRMDVWHEPYGERCAVCLAGAVMARTFHAKDRAQYWPDSFLLKDAEAFRALEAMRNGFIAEAFKMLRIKFPDKRLPAEITAPQYRASHQKFFRYGRNLVRRLKAAGY